MECNVNKLNEFYQTSSIFGVKKTVLYLKSVALALESHMKLNSCYQENPPSIK